MKSRDPGRVVAVALLTTGAPVMAAAAKLEFLAADALHMVAAVETTLDGQLEWHRRTLEYARSARDPKARNWEAAALNNMGVSLNDAGRHEEALAVLRDALAVYQRIGDASYIRIAHYRELRRKAGGS